MSSSECTVMAEMSQGGNAMSHDMQGEGLHFSYFFIPFRYVGDDYDTFRYKLDADIWNIRPYIIKDDRQKASLSDEDRVFSEWGSHFYGHINDRIAGKCFYYTLNQDTLSSVGRMVLIRSGEDVLETDYVISEVSLVHFSTAVGMIIYRVDAINEDADEYTVARMCSELKNPVYTALGTAGGSISLIAAFRTFFTKEVASKMKLLFQYPDVCRGNVNFFSFNYSDSTPGHFTTDAKQLNRMYAARYGYDRDHVHPAGYEYDDYAEILALVEDINFGMTPEGLTCLAYGCTDRADGGRPEYLTGTFRYEFCSTYLFMYILLLHQKYALCSLLKDFVNAPDKKALEDFRSAFGVNEISGEAEYQRLYSKTRRQLAVEGLVQEAEDMLPADDAGVMTKLEDISAHTNSALTVIMTFSIFTALADMAVFMGYMNGSSRKYLWLVIMFSVIIFGTGLSALVYMRKSFAGIFADIKRAQKSHKYLAVILVIFILLMIFAAKWIPFV